MNSILMTFLTDQGTVNSLTVLAERKNKTVSDLINEICIEYIHREMMKMLDNIEGKLKERNIDKEQ